MKTSSIILFGLQALTASACVLVGRSCALGGDECCGRRTCILTSASAGFCVQSQAALAAPAPGQQPRPSQGQQPEFPNPNMGGSGSPGNETMGYNPSMNMPSNNSNNNNNNNGNNNNNNNNNNNSNNGNYGGSGGQNTDGGHNGNGQYNNGQSGNGQYNNGQSGNGQYNNGQPNDGQRLGGQPNNGQLAYSSNSKVLGSKPRVHNKRDKDYFTQSQADPSNHE